MTLEEFDSKAPIRKVIDEIDDCLDVYNTIDRRMNEPGYIMSTKINGIGICSTSYGVHTNHCVSDDKLVEEFRKLLLQRKQELVDEFLS